MKTRFKIRILIPVLLASACIFLSAQDEIPEEVTALIEKRRAAIERIDKIYVQELEGLKIVFTKKGDLKNANRIDALISEASPADAEVATASSQKPSSSASGGEPSDKGVGGAIIPKNLVVRSFGGPHFPFAPFQVLLGEKEIFRGGDQAGLWAIALDGEEVRNSGRFWVQDPDGIEELEKFIRRISPGHLFICGVADTADGDYKDVFKSVGGTQAKIGFREGYLLIGAKNAKSNEAIELGRKEAGKLEFSAEFDLDTGK